jgi:hypothetical protein
MKTEPTRSRPRTRARTVLTLAVAAATGAVALALRAPEPPAAPAIPAASEPAPVLPQRLLSRIESAAAARFAGAEPQVRLPDGRKVAPSNDEHALAIEVNMFKRLLVREAEERDPTFRLRAEAELARRRPLHASISWEDASGNRDLTFTVADAVECGLSGEAEELVLGLDEIAQHPCLDRDNLWEPGTALRVHLEPVGQVEPLWQELLRDTMKQMAAETYLAQTAEAGD